MKFIYKQKFTKILNANPYGEALDQMIFSGFEAEDGSKPQLTDPEIIVRNRDWTQANNEYLAGFFGQSPSVNSGYVGVWTDDVEANAKLYYIIDDKSIREFIISQYNEMRFSNDLDGYDYFVNIDGKLMSAMVEVGDVIFDNYEEAKDSINN